MDVKNITFYYSGDRHTPIVHQSLIESVGSGDLFIDQYYSYTYIYAHELEAQVGIQAFEVWMPEDEEQSRYMQNLW